MNQIIKQQTAFRAAQPATGAGAPIPRIKARVGGEGFASPARPGLLAGLSERVRHYLSVRRTLRALDGLSEEQLKDIGYRRVPGESFSSRYERLP